MHSKTIVSVFHENRDGSSFSPVPKLLAAAADARTWVGLTDGTASPAATLSPFWYRVVTTDCVHFDVREEEGEK